MGLFDMTPDQADNLTNFGFATMANAATPGATLGGAIGKGGLGMNEAALQRAQTQNIGAEAQQKQLSNQLIPLNIQYMKMRLQQAQQDQADDNGTPSPNSGGQPWGATVGGSSPSMQTSARPVNNPGNLRPVGATSGFQQFSTPDAGMQAMKQDLLAKINGSASMNGQPASLRNIIYTYAPPNENNTAAYLENVSKQSGIAPNQILTAADVDKIMPFMVKQEGNSMPDQRNIGQGVNSQVTQQSSLNLPPELQKQIKRLRQERNLTFDPAEQAKIDQQITQIYQNTPEYKQQQKLGEEGATNIAAADKSVAALDSRIVNAKQILQSQIDLAPKTYSGDLGKVMRERAKDAQNFDATKGFQGDKLSAQSTYENNSANLFTQALPAIIPPGSRMDIPFVQAVKAAENTDPFDAPDAKVAVNKNLMKMLDFLQQNVTNNAQLMHELSSPSGTPLSPAMQQIVRQYDKQLSEEPAKSSEELPKSHPMDGTVIKNAKGESMTLKGGKWTQM